MGVSRPLARGGGSMAQAASPTPLANASVDSPGKPDNSSLTTQQLQWEDEGPTARGARPERVSAVTVQIAPFRVFTGLFGRLTTLALVL